MKIFSGSKKLKASPANLTVQHGQREAEWLTRGESWLDPIMDERPARLLKFRSAKLPVGSQFVLVRRAVIRVGVVRRPITEVGYFLAINSDPAAARAGALVMPGYVHRHAAAELFSELCFYPLSQLRPLHVRHLTPELSRAAKRRQLD